MTEKDIEKKLKELEAIEKGEKPKVKSIWEKDYNKLNFDEKVNYWSANIHQQMRWNNESGVDEMAVFSKKDYEHWESQEPNIDELLPHIIQKLPVTKDQVYEALQK